jgi:hypothetical protein
MVDLASKAQSQCTVYCFLHCYQGGHVVTEAVVRTFVHLYIYRVSDKKMCAFRDYYAASASIVLLLIQYKVSIIMLLLHHTPHIDLSFTG